MLVAPFFFHSESMSFASLSLGCLHLAPSNVLAIEAHSEQATIEGDPSLVACERLLFFSFSHLTLEVIMNFAVRINGVVFPFVKYSSAEKAVLQFRGATLHRILGKRGTQFILGGEL